MAQSVRIERARFSDGIGWLSAGGNLMACGGTPLFRVATVLLLFSLLQIVPVIGVPLLLILSPALTAGMLQVFHDIESNRAFGPATMLSGLADPGARLRLMTIGLVFVAGMFFAAMIVAGWISAQTDTEALNRLLADPEAMNEDPAQLFALLEGVNWFGGVALAVLVFGLVLGATYFAVPLVYFWRWPVLAALLFSLRAVLVNWRAFFGFGFVVFGVLLLLGLMIGVFGSILLLALGRFGEILVQLMVILMSLFIQLLMAAAQWRAFLRIFPVGVDPEPPTDA